MHTQRTSISVDDYLAREEPSERRHEYIDGEVYAMAAVSHAHSLLTTNLIRLTSNAARQKGDCHVHAPHMMLRIESRNCCYYPDVSIGCEREDGESFYLTRPCCLIEVLSRSTAVIDRREKRVAYSSLKFLDEYIIVDQYCMRVDVYPRAGRPWLVHVLTEPDDIVEISCLQLKLTLRQIYDGLDLVNVVREHESPEYAAVW